MLNFHGSGSAATTLALYLKVNCMLQCHINCGGVSKESDAETEVSMIVFQQQDAKTPLDLAPPDMVLALEVNLKNSDKNQVKDIVCCLLTVRRLLPQ